jgi:hypothetical protein
MPHLSKFLENYSVKISQTSERNFNATIHNSEKRYTWNYFFASAATMGALSIYRMAMSILSALL